MFVKINVNKNDIKNGVPELYNACPVALAVNRKLKGGYSAEVLDYQTTITDEIGRIVLSHKNNKTTTGFIVNFDLQAKGSPFSFQLRVNKKLRNIFKSI